MGCFDVRFIDSISVSSSYVGVKVKERSNQAGIDLPFGSVVENMWVEIMSEPDIIDAFCDGARLTVTLTVHTGWQGGRSLSSSSIQVPKTRLS